MLLFFIFFIDYDLSMIFSNEFKPLLRFVKEAQHFASVMALLQWDQEVFMPAQALESRSEQLAFLSAQQYRHQCSKDYEKALGTLISLSDGRFLRGDFAAHEKRLLILLWQDWKKTSLLSENFVSEFAALKSQAQYHWQQARSQNKPDLYLPFLDKIIDYSKAYAARIQPTKNPYDVLLNEYEEGMTADRIDALFSPLQAFIVQLIKKTTFKQGLSFSGDFDIDIQQKLNQDLLKNLGFDYQKGRLDVSTHPFTTSFHPYDVRLTTRYSSSDLMEALSSTVHEAGHGLYEQGLPLEWAATPLGQARSLGLHESQSRLWENMVLKSRPFWSYFYPKCQVAFPHLLGSISQEQFYEDISRVQPSFIRVEADEVSYNLHILIRFQLERALIQGDLAVNDLEQAWNDAYEENLGMRPTTVSEGFLQDVHWSCGLFGYFPTYTLGNLYSAQLYETLLKEIPDLEDHFRKGSFNSLLKWLRDKVHVKAALYTPETLMQEITGQGLGSDAFLSYLRLKFE